MKKLSTLIGFAALAMSMSAADGTSTTVHQGNGMKGTEAYSEVKFTCGDADGQAHDDVTAKAVYTMSVGTDSKLEVTSLNFENLEPSVFIGLVDACYMWIDGVGETPMTLTDGTYTATTAAALTTGQTYTGFFKRMSAGTWYGGELKFPFTFVFTADGDGTVGGGGDEPDEPIEPTNIWDAAKATMGAVYYAPDWQQIEDFDKYTFTGNGLTVDLTNEVYQDWQAQFPIVLDTNMAAKNYYKFSYDIHVDGDLTYYFKLFQFQDGNDGNIFCDNNGENIDVKAGTTLHYSYAGQGKDMPKIKLLFDFRKFPAGMTVEIKNIELIVSSTELTADENTVTPDKPAGDEFDPMQLRKLYMVGDKLNGKSWDLANPIELTYSATGDGEPRFDALNVTIAPADGNEYAYFMFITEPGADWDAINANPRLGADSANAPMGIGVYTNAVWYKGGQQSFSWETTTGLADVHVVCTEGNWSIGLTKVEQGAIETIGSDSANAPVEYFNLQGVRINEPAAGSIVIRRQGNEVSKIRF